MHASKVVFMIELSTRGRSLPVLNADQPWPAVIEVDVVSLRNVLQVLATKIQESKRRICRDPISKLCIQIGLSLIQQHPPAYLRCGHGICRAYE